MRLLIRPRPATPANRIDLGPITLKVQTRPLRVLDFDCECRPLHWISGDYVSKEITAIAWAWTDQPDDVTCYLLGETDTPTMLRAFSQAWREADVVTGHYIRGFDVTLINGALTEYQMPLLPDKLTHDTKLDLTRRHGLSGSQENIGAMLGLEHEKVKMNQRSWRDANRLTPEGLALARKRVVGDVQQHIEMRKRLLELGYLGSPKLWKSGVGAVTDEYVP